jgi:2-haloacid dehalogenase
LHPGKGTKTCLEKDAVLVSGCRRRPDDQPGHSTLYEPSREAYGYVERELGVEPAQPCHIACHTWDTLGAVAAGWEAALIKRVGNDVLGVGPQPQIVGDDLNDVADQIIARHAAGHG